MKNGKFILKVICAAWLAVSVGLIVLGVALGLNGPEHKVNTVMLFVGVGMLGVFGVAMTVAYSMRLLSEAKRFGDALDGGDARADEEAYKEDINNSRGNRFITDARAAGHYLHAVKAARQGKAGAPQRGKAILSLLFVAAFIGCCIGFAVCLVTGHNTAGFVFIGAGFGLIFIALIVYLIVSKISANNNYAAGETVPATVVSCICVGEQTIATGAYRNTEKNRVFGTTYLVTVELDGEILQAYCKRFFNEKETVYVRRHKLLKNTVIIVGWDEGEKN